MDRRSFIGSVIGMMGTLPFKAEATPVISRINDDVSFARKAALLALNPDELKRCRLCVLDGNGDSWWAPPIKDVKITNGRREFYCHGVTVSRQITYRGVGIFNHQNQFCGTADFSSHVTMVPGDQLNITYSVYR